MGPGLCIFYLLTILGSMATGSEKITALPRVHIRWINLKIPLDSDGKKEEEGRVVKKRGCPFPSHTAAGKDSLPPSGVALKACSTFFMLFMRLGGGRAHRKDTD